MGVPKFYRWISERYPCLSQVIKEHQIPEFDNLYLDMNGLIHPCSHPNDEDAHFRISEQEIFENIFNYIDCLFRLIKPRKVFFMAVDGVAPRAKMNQQRSRRFRSAMDAERQRKAALAKGETLPTEEKFDSNCITPGTNFMCKLHEQLKYFVNKKLSTDPAWREIRVILSGHDVPGEGEHKVMEFIRHAKMQPNYDPSTRHCLYGLDADLILLGLATHELHFSLLREEVKYCHGRKKNRITSAEEQCFHLLHLSLFREYVDHEFSCLKKSLGDAYDHERIIDDFILLSFLVGNDFIPHLPAYHIHSGSLPELWSTYKDVRATLDGYLHKNGDLNMDRFGAYLEVLSKRDLERFEDQYEDLKWMAGKSEERKSKGQKQLETDRLKAKFGAMMLDGSSDEEEEEDEVEEGKMLENEFQTHKRRYYMSKFNVEKAALEEFMEGITFKYVEGLQWILQYYFQGVPSWSWYYPYHYAPYLSDVVGGVRNMVISLDPSTPFTPFQQLMAVLPPGSNQLLPAPLRTLYEETSPILDFYPAEFETDLNGKKQEWEAVTLIPFIDEARLIEAMATVLPSLTPEEAARNSHGQCIIGTFDPESSGTYPSSLSNVFPDIDPCHAKIAYEPRDCFHVAPAEVVPRYPDPAVDPFRMGFPTTRHLPHTVDFDAAGCRVFNMNSRDVSCILYVDPQEERPLEEYKAMVGEVVYVAYPHLVEALVIGIHTETDDYTLEEKSVVRRPAQPNKKDCFKHLKSRECISLKSRWGIEVGDVRVMVSVRKIRGKVPCYQSDGTISVTRHWCEERSYFPGQLVINNVDFPVPVQERWEDLSLANLFPQAAKVFLVANPGYGSMGCVKQVVLEESKVMVDLTVNDESMLEELRSAVETSNSDWYFSREICPDLGISALLLSKIASSFSISVPNRSGSGSTNVNIGMNIKFANRSLMAPEYARKLENAGWQYSDSFVPLVKKYVKKFPELFAELEHHLKADDISAAAIAHKFGPDFNVREYLDKVRKFVKSLNINNNTLVGAGSVVMPSKFVPRLMEDLKKYRETAVVNELRVKVKPRVLFNPELQNGILPPDQRADFHLCDRVVNVCSSHCVPFGYKGTIVGIRCSESQASDDVKYDVLFDEPFIGGGKYGECGSQLYTMLPFTLLNISYGTRLATGAKAPKKATAPPEPRKGQVGKREILKRRDDVWKPAQPIVRSSVPVQSAPVAAAPAPKPRETYRRRKAPSSGEREWSERSPTGGGGPPFPVFSGYMPPQGPHYDPMSPVSPLMMFPPGYQAGYPPMMQGYCPPPYHPGQFYPPRYMAHGMAPYMPAMGHPGYGPPGPTYPGMYDPSRGPTSPQPESGNKPLTKSERRQEEARYEEQFYHGEFYPGPAMAPPYPPAMWGAGAGVPPPNFPPPVDQNGSLSSDPTSPKNEGQAESGTSTVKGLLGIGSPGSAGEVEVETGPAEPSSPRPEESSTSLPDANLPSPQQVSSPSQPISSPPQPMTPLQQLLPPAPPVHMMPVFIPQPAFYPTYGGPPMAPYPTQVVPAPAGSGNKTEQLKQLLTISTSPGEDNPPASPSSPPPSPDHQPTSNKQSGRTPVRKTLGVNFKNRPKSAGE